jgi:hypothetical protein
MCEKLVEFFAYETVGMCPAHVAGMPVIDVAGYRIMFPNDEECQRFVAMNETERGEYLANTLRRQNGG